jgi:HEAT repeat protein
VAALKDPYSKVRKAAAEALVQIGAPAVEPFMAALKDESWSVRRTAAEALGQIGDARAVEPLTAALKDRNDHWLRHYAAEALGQIGDARAVEPLVAALKEPYANVRKAAAEALEALGWQPDRTEMGERTV